MAAPQAGSDHERRTTLGIASRRISEALRDAGLRHTGMGTHYAEGKITVTLYPTDTVAFADRLAELVEAERALHRITEATGVAP